MSTSKKLIGFVFAVGMTGGATMSSCATTGRNEGPQESAAVYVLHAGKLKRLSLPNDVAIVIGKQDPKKELPSLPTSEKRTLIGVSDVSWVSMDGGVPCLPGMKCWTVPDSCTPGSFSCVLACIRPQPGSPCFQACQCFANTRGIDLARTSTTTSPPPLDRR